MKFKVLLITDHFPPKSGVATARTAALYKYLNSELFEVQVLSEGIPNAGPVRSVSGKHWLSRFNFDRPSGRFVHRLKALWNRFVKLLTVDENPGFYRNGRTIVLDWHKKSEFDLVISSYCSLASLRLGYDLKRSFPKIFWVCDFRDEMSKNHDVNFWDKWRLKRWEARFVKCADMLTSVSEPILGHFSRLNPSVPAVEVRNGFDFSPIRDEKTKTENFEILYAGMLYGYINLDGFFSGWLQLPEAQRSRIRLKIVGPSPSPSIPAVLADFVQIFCAVSYSDMPKLLSQADAFLLVNHSLRRRGVFTGKLFDYLAVNRPILALMEPTDVGAELIRAANAGYVCPDRDAKAIAGLLKRALADWESNNYPQRVWEVVEKHHRREQIGIFQQALDCLLSEKSSLKGCN